MSDTARSTLDPAEAEKFARIAAQWWDPKGQFAPLHKMNPVRLAYLRREIAVRLGIADQGRRPFAGLSIVDVGCGGGLVAEPMARLGANVIGLDAAGESLAVARLHAEQSGLAIAYQEGTAEGLAEAQPGGFDAVLALEIVEHVADVSLFAAACARLARPGGAIIFSTINRTPQARALAIVLAERVLRWVPEGSHEYERLVPPQDLISACRVAGLEPGAPQGLSWRPLAGAWALSDDLSINYFLAASKPVRDGV